MHEFNTPPALRGEQAAPESISLIGQLAVAMRQARDCITYLECMAGDLQPVDPRDGPSGVTWEALLHDLRGWDYQLEYALLVLDSRFQYDIEAAFEQAGFGEDLDDLDDDTKAAPEPVPAMVELPAAKARPYWLSTEDVR